MPRRRSSQVKPIRLGNQDALPLSDYRDSCDPAETRVEFDWAALYQALGLERPERAFLEQKKIGAEQPDIARTLRWTRKKIQAVHRRIRRALRDNVHRRTDFERVIHGGNSRSRLSYQETLACGRRAWSLADLGEGFPAIMAAERANIFARPCPFSASLGGSSRSTRVEHKIYKQLELKTSISEPGSFVGVLSTYGGVDEYSDTIQRGAYEKTLRETGGRLPLLWQHDPKEPIGEVLLKDGPKGLEATGRLILDDNVPVAKKAYSLLKAGVIKGMSIGYRAVQATQRGSVRVLTEIRLFEASLVTMPADPGALISTVKTGRNATAAEIAEIIRQSTQKYIAGLYSLHPRNFR